MRAAGNGSQRTNTRWTDWLHRPGVGSRIVRVVLFLLGIVLILIGFLLGFVPLLPGFPLGVAGVMLLSLSSSRVRAGLRQVIRYLPQRVRTRFHFLHRQTEQR